MTAQTLEARYIEAIERGNIALRCRLEAELDAQTDADDERLNAPDALIKAALWYARRGVAVFPCEPRGKAPLGRLARNGLKDASTDPAVVARWWQAEPNANIGAPTGLTFDVIDIDGREGVGAMYFDEDRPTMPPEIGHVLTARTAGHHVFVKPSGHGNKAGIYPSVDYRGAGGYVILPPSITDIHGPGRRYRWTKPLQIEATS